MSRLIVGKKRAFCVGALTIVIGILGGPAGAAWQGKRPISSMQRSLPDLAVTVLHGSCEKDPAPVLKVDVSVKNLEGGGVSAEFVTTVEGRIFLPAGHGPNPNQTVTQQIAVGEHPSTGFAGEESFSFLVPIPSGTTSVKLRAHADRNGQVKEKDETNNSRDLQVACPVH